MLCIGIARDEDVFKPTSDNEFVVFSDLIVYLALKRNTFTSCSCSWEREAVQNVLPQFVPRMSHKWDTIGSELGHEEFVTQLWSSAKSNEEKLQQILDEWLRVFVPNPRRTLSNILRSSTVGLDDVAKDFEVGRLHIVHSGLGHRHNRYPRCAKVQNILAPIPMHPPQDKD